MKFQPTVASLEDRNLLSSFGGGNVNYSIPRLPTTSPSLNFTSNTFHQINASIPNTASSILANQANTNAQLSAYVARIPNGTTTFLPILEKDVAIFEHNGFMVSTAAANTSVTTLYNDLLGRNPDPGGLSYFSSALQSGATVQQVADVMVQSNEYYTTNTVTGATAAANEMQFVDSLYNNVLGRAPDAGGEAAWINAIDTNTLTYQQVAHDFVYSAEAMTSSTSVLQTAALPVANTMYYFGSVVPGGPITGNYAGTGATAQLENLIQQDTLAYLGNGIGTSFNVLKSNVSWSSDKLLTYNGRV